MICIVNAQSLSNRRGDLDGEKVVKAASKADCVLALNGESCVSQCHEIISAFFSQRFKLLYALFTYEQTT